MSDLAAALLKDVPRYVCTNAGDMEEDAIGAYVHWHDLIAALTTALDPAIAERAGLIVERLRAMPIRGGLHGITTASHAADLITALLAQNAALRAERDNLSDKLELERALTDGAHRRARAAEAERDALRDDLQHAQSEAKEAATLAKWCRDAFAEKLTEAELYQLQRVWEFADAAALTTEADNG